MSFLLAMFLMVMPAIAADSHVERDYEISLTKGQYAIELQEFGSAIGHLKRALELRPKDQTARVALGIAYARSGDNLRAREILQQAVDADGSDGRARYELALVLEKLGQTEESHAQMARAAKSSDPELSGAAKGYLEGTGGEKPRLTARLNGGFQYDSNVILEPDAPVVPGMKNADWRAVLALNADYSFFRSGKADAAIGYAFYQSLHADLSDYNVQQHTGRVAARYGLTSAAIADVEYDFQYSLVGAEHYSTMNWFAVSVPVKLTAESVTRPHAAYELKRFFDTSVFTGQPARNGSNTAFGVSHMVMLDKRAGVAFDYTYDANSAEVTSWSYAGNKGTVNGIVEWGSYKAFASLSYYDRKYEAALPGAPAKRHDGVQEYAAGVTWKTGRGWSVTLSDDYTINDSNLPAYQYTRNILSLIAELRL